MDTGMRNYSNNAPRFRANDRLRDFDDPDTDLFKLFEYLDRHSLGMSGGSVDRSSVRFNESVKIDNIIANMIGGRGAAHDQDIDISEQSPFSDIADSPNDRNTSDPEDPWMKGMAGKNIYEVMYLTNRMNYEKLRKDS